MILVAKILYLYIVQWPGKLALATNSCECITQITDTLLFELQYMCPCMQRKREREQCVLFVYILIYRLVRGGVISAAPLLAMVAISLRFSNCTDWLK